MAYNPQEALNLATDLLEIIRSSRTLQRGWLRMHKNMTMAQARALPKAERDKLSAEYKAWYDANHSS